MSSRGGASSCATSRTVIPAAALTEEQQEQGMVYAHKAFQALDCTGVASIAFFLDEGGHWYFNEAVPQPSMAETSLYATVWRERGVGYSDLMHRLIILALSRSRRAQRQRAHVV